MKRNKAQNIREDTNQIVAVFKALSDPSRFRLVKLLACRVVGRTHHSCGEGPLCVNALARELKMTQSAVSQHLRILRNIGLVRAARRGAFMHYSVERDPLDRALQTVRSLIGE